MSKIIAPVFWRNERENWKPKLVGGTRENVGLNFTKFGECFLSATVYSDCRVTVLPSVIDRLGSFGMSMRCVNTFQSDGSFENVQL